MRCLLWLLALCGISHAVAQPFVADGSVAVAVDGHGDLSVTPLAGRSVLIQGVNVPATLASLDGRLRTLEGTLQMAVWPAPAPPVSGPATSPATVPRIGQDSLGNLLLIPAPNRTLVLVGVRVLELLTHVAQRLAAVEDRVFGRGLAPNATSVPPPSSASRPGTVGLGADGHIRIEPLAGRTVLAAGRDLVLELHRIAMRLNSTETAMAACACLAPPATCRPCNAEGCHVPLLSSSSLFCSCSGGWQGPDCRENRDECASDEHGCSPNASCTDTVGSFVCTCKPGFTGNGSVCANVDECASGAHSCSLNATCTDAVGSPFFTCVCKPGFSGNGVVCVNIDECASGAHNCSPNATCTDVSSGSPFFTCACRAGFAGNGVACAPVGNIPALKWARQAGSTSLDGEGRVAVDDAGRVFLFGQARGIVDNMTYAGGFFDLFLVAYDGDTGAKLWSRMLGSSGDDNSYGIAVDSTGSVFLTGYTSGGLDGQASAGGIDAFLVRYDGANGTRMWTRLLGTTSADYSYCVAVDVSIPDAVFFGGVTFNATGGGLPGSAGGLGGDRDAFVARYASNGTRVWVRQFGSSGDDYCYGVAVYQSEVYAVGYTSGVMAGSPSAGSSDIFVTKITAQGVVAWTAQLGSPRSDFCESVAVDSSGVYVTGWTGGSISGQSFAGGVGDAFVARFTLAGNWTWTRLLGTTAGDFGTWIALDRSSNVFITGYTNGIWGGQATMGSNDAFVASFSSDGTLLWTRLFGTATVDVGDSIAFDRSGGGGIIYVAGQTSGAMYGQQTLGQDDVFLLRLQYACAAGQTGDGVNCTNIDECASGTHSCSPNATCTDAVGSPFFTCACKADFTGNGSVCTPHLTGTLEWVRQVGSTTDDFPGRVAVDTEGRVFLTGYVGGAAEGFNVILGGNDVLLMAYNSSTGTKLWSQRLSSSGEEYCNGIAADGTGSVYLAGHTNGATLDGHTGAGSSDILLVRYVSSNGTRLWTQLLGTTNSDFGHSVAVNRSGSADAVYVGGSTMTTSGSGMPGSAGGIGGVMDAVVVRYDSSGTRVWVLQFGTADIDLCYGLAVYQSDIYVTGYTSGTMPGATSVGGRDIFVSKITALGSVVWTVQLGSTGPDEGRGIAVDSSGIFVTGKVSGVTNGQPFAGSEDAIVARYTHAGTRVWTRLLGTSANDQSHGLALDRNSNVLIAGYSSGAVGGQANTGLIDVLVASFNSSGTLLWTRLVGTEANDNGYSIALVDSSNNNLNGSSVYVGGSTGGAMYGQSSAGGLDLFLLKLQL